MIIRVNGKTFINSKYSVQCILETSYYDGIIPKRNKVEKENKRNPSINTTISLLLIETLKNESEFFEGC